MEVMSEYFMSLSSETRERYESKVVSAGLAIDPYSISEWEEDPQDIPSVTWSDMVYYMTNTPSPYTREELKAWKGMLDGESFLRAGWVHGLKLHSYTGPQQKRFLIKGKVMHSQRTSGTPLIPWVVPEEDGEILVAHCNCMAGLGEACSHIAAIISSLVAANSIRQRSASVTSQRCMWLPPAKSVTPAKICEIKFRSSSGKRQRCDSGSTDATSSQNKTSTAEISDPSDAELNTFYDGINNYTKRKPGILKISPPYSDNFIPILSQSIYPTAMMELYNPEALTLQYHDLLTECERTIDTIKVTAEQIAKLEEVTRGQSSTKS
ncbi:uncharacterized protein [Dysidea avara]|uniref:uncharacterized protein n=1 Tax=Dysidea avara TaxID=196820 RepID=UPI003317D59C